MKTLRRTGAKALTGLFVMLSVCLSVWAEDIPYIGGTFGDYKYVGWGCGDDPLNELVEYRLTDVKSKKKLFWCKTPNEYELWNVSAGDTFTIHCSVKGYPNFVPDYSWCNTEGWISCDDEGHVKILKTSSTKYCYLKPNDANGTFPMDNRPGIKVYPWNHVLGNLAAGINGFRNEKKIAETLNTIKTFCPWLYDTGDPEIDMKKKFRYDEEIRSTKTKIKQIEYFYVTDYFNVRVKKDGTKYRLEWEKQFNTYLTKSAPHYYVYQSTGDGFERLKKKYGSTETTHYMMLSKCPSGSRFIIAFQYGNDEYCTISNIYTYQGGGTKASSKTSTVKTKKITGIKKKYTLKAKKTLKLKPVLTPKNSTQKITYKSSNKKVATVSSSGKVTAKKPGKTVITITSGSKKAKTTIIVKKK